MVYVTSRAHSAIGYKPQETWGLQVAIAQWILGVGAGLGFVATTLVLFGPMARVLSAIAASVVLIFIGLLTLLFEHGIPRGQRISSNLMAVSNWRRSWISRGFIADNVFIVLGLMIIGFDIAGFRFAGSGLNLVFAMSALVVMVYLGIAMASMPSLSFWNTGLVPLQFLTTSLASAVSMMLVALDAFDFSGIKTLESYQLLILSSTFGLTIAHVVSKYYAKGAARESVLLLTKGWLSKFYIGGVLLLGLVAPLVLTGYAYLVTGTLALGALTSASVLVLSGALLLRYCLFRAGIHPPLL